MGSSQFLSSFLLLLLFFHHTVIITGEEDFCPVFTCGGLTEPEIRFPFRLRYLQAETCGYPEFDLTCNNRTILKISSSGEFWLQKIDYINQQIRVNDPDGCLPNRLFQLDLWSSPFRTALYQNYTMLRCPTAIVQGMPPIPYNPISCLSNSSGEIWATASTLSVDMMVSSRGCEVMTTVKVPIPWSGYYDNSDMSFSDLSGDLTLSWDVPQCGDCVEKGGRCGFKSSSSLEVECFGISQQGGMSRSVSYAVTIGIGVPTLLCGIGIACYASGRFKRYRRSNPSNGEEVTGTGGGSSAVNPHPTVVATGLDNSTIEAYPKSVVGESRRMVRDDDNTCSICLAEYQPRETLRTIPQCQHCFHVDCIDEWLRMNPTCPICRNSPAPIMGSHPP